MFPKVIFENCYLTDEEKEEMCRITLNIGPDYIKTFTWFGTGGAALEDLALMKRMAGDKIRVKAAGSVRNLDTALAMIDFGVNRIVSIASILIIEELKKCL